VIKDWGEGLPRYSREAETPFTAVEREALVLRREAGLDQHFPEQPAGVYDEHVPVA
jgi:hypothetical protein